jgi:hypothetical protein
MSSQELLQGLVPDGASIPTCDIAPDCLQLILLQAVLSVPDEYEIDVSIVLS